MKTKYITIFFVLSALFFSQDISAKKHKIPEGIYAKIITTKGVMNFKIEYTKLPLPSCVFIGLAEGTLENKLLPLGTKFYDNQKIYNVNKDKFILFGDPSNNDNIDVGFHFHDQIDSSFLHSTAGIIGIANQGPNTNGTQFYITKKPMPNLDYKYTIFGSMLSGFDVLYLLTPTDTVKHIEITRVGDKAKQFICNYETFQKYQFEQFNKSEAIKQRILQNFTDSIYKYYPATVTLPSGLKMFTLQEGKGANPCEKCKVEIKYTARFESGLIFDQTDTLKPISTQLGVGFLKRGLEEGIKNMVEGQKAIIFIPYTLAYGETGYKERIPPRANIIYELELVRIIKE